MKIFALMCILLNVHGLSLPLKTVTKCESFPKKSPKLKTECAADNLASDNSKLDKTISSLLPIDTRAKSPVAADGIGVNGIEIPCNAPAIPKNVPFRLKTTSTVLSNSGATILGSDSLNCAPITLFSSKLPTSVPSTLASLPSPNLKPIDISSSCSKKGMLSSTPSILEDCVSASTVQSTPLILTNQVTSSNSAYGNPNACGNNAYSSGFKSSLSVSSVGSNSDSKNLNSLPANPNLSLVNNQLPVNLESASQSLQSQNVIIKQDSMPPQPTNQICSLNVVSNLPSNQCTANVGPQSYPSNSLPTSVPCGTNAGSNSLVRTQSCSNISPLSQSYPTNTGASMIPPQQLNMCPNKSPLSNNVPLSQECTSNIVSNNIVAVQGCQTNTLSNFVPSLQAGPSNIGSNNLPISQGCSANIGPDSNILPQKCQVSNGLTTPTNFAPSNSAAGITPTISNNNLNQDGNLFQNTLSNQLLYSPKITDSNVPLSNTQCVTSNSANCDLSTLSLCSGANIISASPKVSSNIIPACGMPLTSTFIPSPGFPSSPKSCASDIPVNTFNNQQNIPPLNAGTDVAGSKPFSSKQSYVPAISMNANNVSPNYQNSQLNSEVPIAGKSLIPIVQDAVIYPTIQTYPPPANIFPVSNTLPLTDQVPILPLESSTNSCPLTPISRTSINEYFKGVKAATSKLNDFISSFSNKFGIKSFPSMQPYSSMLYESIPQSNIVTCQCSEDKCESALPLSPTRPGYAASLQVNSPTVLVNDICENLAQKNQECTSTYSSTTQDTNQSGIPPVSLVQSSCDNIVTRSSVCSPSPTVSQSVSISATPQSSSPTATFKAPIVPKTIVSSFNYPICPTPVSNFVDSLTSLSCNNYSPYSLTNLPKAVPSNLLSSLNIGSFKLPDISPTSVSPSSYRPISSIVNSGNLNTPLITNPIVSSNDDMTSILLPDILSCVLPKKSYPCETCRKAFPFLSSISINTCLNSDSSSDSSTALSSIDECSVDLSSAQNFCVPSIDESQLDECCKNLEDIIAMLELSLNLNGGFDCDLDSVPDILFTL